MSNDDISLKIKAAVEDNNEISALRDNLTRLGGDSTETSAQLDDLSKTVDTLNDAFKISQAINDANAALSESEQALLAAKVAYEETAEAAVRLNEAGTPDPLINARLRQQANEVARLERVNNSATVSQLSARASYDASSESVRRLVDNEQELQNVIDQTREAQITLNSEMQNALDVMGARESLGLNDAQRVQEEIQKISDEYRLLAETGILTADELVQAQRSMEEQLRRLRGETDPVVESFGALAAKAVSFAAVAKGLSDVTKEAVDFESAMANVSKFLDWDKQKVDGLAQSLVELSNEIPISAQGLAEIASAGAQIGLNTTADIAKFTTMVAKMATAFDMSTDAAGKSLATLKTVFGLTIDQVESLGNAINHLSNTSGQDASAIIEVLSRMGGTAQSIGLAADQAGALAAALLSVGKTPEIAGTALNSFLGILNTATAQGVDFKDGLNEIGMSAAQLAQEIKANPQVAIENLLTKFDELSQVDSAKSSEIIQKMFGKQQAAHIETLVKSLSKLKEQFRAVGDDTQYAGSVQKEFETRMATTAAQLQLLQNGFQNISINIGTAFLPTINESAKSLGSMTEAIAKFAETHPNITKLIATTTLLTASVVALTSAYKLLVAPAVASLASITTAALAQARALNVVHNATLTLKTGLAAVGGVGAAAFAGWSFGTFLNEFESVRRAMNWVTGWAHGIVGVFKNIATFNFKNIFNDINSTRKAYRELNEENKQSTIDRRRLEAEAKQKELDDIKAVAAAKKAAALAETERLNALKEQYKDVVVEAGALNEKGEIKAHVLDSIQRTNEYLENMGLNYKSVAQGMTVQGEKVISSIKGMATESTATSAILTTTLIAALDQIQTPKELEMLNAQFLDLSNKTKLTTGDLAMLSPIFGDISAKIAEGLPAGAAFDEALGKWASSASNAAKGIKELTVEQETLNTQLAKEIDLINLTISSEIKKLKAKQDLARALGDVNGEAALGNEIAKLEVKLAADVAAITARKLALDKQVLASLQAKVASGQKLTASELAQKEALEKAIIENETAIAVYKISIETKRAEALASGQVIAGNEGIATSATGAASATAGLSNEMSGLADTASSAKTEVDEAVQSFSSGNIAGSAKNWSLINEQTRKELQETAKYWNHLTSYQRTLKKKEIQAQVDEYDRLMQKMSDVKEMSAEEAEKMLASFKRLNLLDQQQMASMKSQLYDIVQRSKEAKEAVSNEVQARIKAISDEATGAVDGALKKLDELNNRSKDQNESKASEMEAKAAQAAAEGNQEAAAKFLEAAQLFDEIARKEKANERMKQQQVAHDAYMSKKEPEVLGYYEIKVEAGNKVMTLPAPTKEFVKQFFDVIEQVKRTSM